MIEAENTIKSLALDATQTIATLQDAVDLEMATDNEKARLDAWKRYRVELMRFDPNLAPEINYPTKPD